MAISEAVTALLGFSQRQIDRVVSPESRQKAYAQTSDFAVARPVLFAFILTQLTFSLIPLLIFISFVATVSLFALGVALLFILFWLGVALAVLIPTICVTGAVATGVWAWALASYLVARWLYGFSQGAAAASSTLQPYDKLNGFKQKQDVGGGPTLDNQSF